MFHLLISRSGLQEDESLHLFCFLIFSAPGVVSGAPQVPGTMNIQAVCEGWGQTLPAPSWLLGPLSGPGVPTCLPSPPQPSRAEPPGGHKAPKPPSPHQGPQPGLAPYKVPTRPQRRMENDHHPCTSCPFLCVQPSACPLQPTEQRPHSMCLNNQLFLK